MTLEERLIPLSFGRLGSGQIEAASGAVVTVEVKADVDSTTAGIAKFLGSLVRNLGSLARQLLG